MINYGVKINYNYIFYKPYTYKSFAGTAIVGQLIPWTIDPMPFLTWVDIWSHIVLPDWTFGPILFLTK